MQRQEVISSDTEEVSNVDAADIFNNVASQDPMKRVFALGKMNRILKDYCVIGAPKLKDIDKRLLKGFYVSNAIELENEEDSRQRTLDLSNLEKVEGKVEK